MLTQAKYSNKALGTKASCFLKNSDKVGQCANTKYSHKALGTKTGQEMLHYKNSNMVGEGANTS